MIHSRVNGLVGLKVERHLLFLALVGQNRADKEHQTVGRHTVVELEPLLCTRDGCEH